MKATIFIVCLMITVKLVRANNIDLLVTASTHFCLKLYKEIAIDEPNCVFSPHGIHSALTMALLGARTGTESELTDKLRLSNFGNHQFHQAYRDIISQYNLCAEVRLHVAYGLFLNPSIQFSHGYLTSVTNYYKGKVAPFNFTAPEGPEKAINDFVEEKTEGQIKDLIPPGAIDHQTSMILVNTLFFNGTWSIPFNENLTCKEEFYRPDGTITWVDMMHDERSVFIKRDYESTDVLELPFKDPRFSLYIIMSIDPSGFAEIESAFVDPSKLTGAMIGLKLTKVQLAFPKFRILSEFLLRDPLKELGVSKAFDPSIADFSGISPGGNIYIDEIVHKMVIEVTETGTVAAAATAVTFGTTSAGSPATEVFNVNHSFIGCLVDKRTKNIIAMFKHTG